MSSIFYIFWQPPLHRHIGAEIVDKNKETDWEAGDEVGRGNGPDNKEDNKLEFDILGQKQGNLEGAVFEQAVQQKDNKHRKLFGVFVVDIEHRELDNRGILEKQKGNEHLKE